VFKLGKIRWMLYDLPFGVSLSGPSWISDLPSEFEPALRRILLEELHELLGIVLAETSVLYRVLNSN
jgi:hypothetical protein